MKGQSPDERTAQQSTGNPPSSEETNSELQATTRPVEVSYLDTPTRIVRHKSIHPRRLPPFITEGLERPFHSHNTRAIIHKEAAAAPDIQIVLNKTIPQPGQNHTASNVGEPSLSANGDVVFYTGNWYAALSLDGGNTFSFIDPNSFAQPNDPPGVTFCCDQVVNYMPSIDTFVWLMQYGPSTGDNIQRLAFAKTDDVKAGKWKIFDITTQMLGIPGFFMDFPDLAVGTNFLYVTTNCFGPDGKTAGSAVARIPIAKIAQGNPSLEKFVPIPMDLFSFRVAQNCADTAYFSAHKDTSTLSVFSWPETQPTPASVDVPIARWLGTNGYVSRTPDGRRWLDRVDPRLTGATLAGNELWFAWSVDANSNHRAKPFVQMARISLNDMSLIEDVNLFDADSAIAYAGLATNANNEVAVSYMIGGDVFPSHVVGFLSNNRLSVVVGKGERSPMPDQQGHYEWGDYLTARPVFPDRTLFAAAGYTLAGTTDGDNQDATPRFVIFGRRNGTTAGTGALTGTGAPGNVAGGAAGATGGAGDGVAKGGNGGGGFGAGPITDVNQLSTVSSAVAAQIKAACGIFSASGAPKDVARPEVAMPELVTKPGSERWPVKTGQDPNRNAVGKNVINGKDLGAGIVPTTVEELISIPRPPGLEVLTADPPAFQNKRSQPVESTIWQVEVTITVVNQEADGDNHLVIQGSSGATMVAEVPTPTSTFIGDSPWLANIKEARQAVNDKLLHTLSPKDFVLPPGGRKLVPRDSLSGDIPTPRLADFKMPESFVTPPEGEDQPTPTFQTAVKPTRARITGVGFFDRAHGATGAAPNVIEIHPVLKIEWL
jgi:hypothetical protein